MLPELIACDLDGTLLRDDGTVSARTRAALDAVRGHGTHLVLATGRPWVIARRTAHALDLESFVITSNGSYTVRAPSGEEFHSVWLETDVAVAVIAALRRVEPTLGFAIEYERGMYNEAGFADRLPHAIPSRDPLDDVLTTLDVGGRVRNVVVFGDRFDASTPALRRLAVKALDGTVDVEVKYAGLPFVQIAPRGVDKAAALETICSYLSIERTEVVAFGDESNDIGMLQWAGTGVAMATAPPEVLAVADEVTADNSGDGVAVVLERYLD
ncbi:MAG: Cof-type HAD-IIB family hydrolase [Acidimicrobiia bacterium]|nr:Cof-type HAD-IIB family hydrolase [Acidimicrobiia bacterium]